MREALSMNRYSCGACAAVLALPLSWSVVVAGELPVVGTGDGVELLKVIGAAYSAEHPQTVVLVPPSIHSSGGIAAVGSEKEVLGRIARPLSESEKANGIISVPVFRLPAALYVHPSAGVSNLSAKQLAAIYAGSVTNWREVGGSDLRIKVVRREDVDSTLNVLRDSMPGWKNLVITEKSKTATTTQDAVDTVSSVPGAIGFGPYTKELERNIVVLRIDGKYPTDQDYPSAVTLSLIYKNNTVTSEAKGFVDFFKTAKGKNLLSSLGGVPIKE
jgi:phosphate transport system substrate-binding protein